MNYLTSMGNLLMFRTAHLREETSPKQLQYTCIVNVLVLGLVYGCSAALLSKLLLAGKGLDTQSFNFMKIVIAGIPAAFLMHAGAALFIWVFLRAIGGKADFITAYFFIGVAAISLWPVAPFITAFQAGVDTIGITLLALITTMYAFCLNVGVIKTAFQLSTTRMAIATSVTVMYISCFLYLWV